MLVRKELLDEYGNRTGEFEILYSDPYFKS